MAQLEAKARRYHRVSDEMFLGVRNRRIEILETDG
jgi:hypothetical protein